MKRTAAVLMIAVFALVFLAACKAGAPKPNEAEAERGILSFTTEDLDGNVRNSSDIFAANKITMINVWATWCGPCVRELPELQRLSSELSELGCGLISVLEDSDTENGIRDAKLLISSNGMTYPVLKTNGGIRSQLPMQYLPTTFFVDSSGRLVGEPIIGAQVDRYLSAVRELLEND